MNKKCNESKEKDRMACEAYESCKKPGPNKIIKLNNQYANTNINRDKNKNALYTAIE